MKKQDIEKIIENELSHDYEDIYGIGILAHKLHKKHQQAITAARIEENKQYIGQMIFEKGIISVDGYAKDRINKIKKAITVTQ